MIYFTPKPSLEKFPKFLYGLHQAPLWVVLEKKQNKRNFHFKYWFASECYWEDVE